MKADICKLEAQNLPCRFVPLLYSLLDSKEEEIVQAGALEVLTEIGTKRMDAEAKLRLLQQLGLVSRAASWQHQLPGSPDSEVPLKAARLLASLCTGGYGNSEKIDSMHALNSQVKQG